MWNAMLKLPQTEWLLCSDDWQDIVIIDIPQPSDTPIEDNYVDISLKKIKDAYFKNLHPLNLKRTCQKWSKFKLTWVFFIEFYNYFMPFISNLDLV